MIDTITEYRYSDCGTIRVGQEFRARGGPTYGDKRVGMPGRYRLNEIVRKGERVWFVATPIDKYGIPSGGEYMLFVSGTPYRLKTLPNWVVRPYRIARIRAVEVTAKEKRKKKR